MFPRTARALLVPPRMKARCFLPLLLCACGARTGLSQTDVSSDCHATAPICVQNATDPCGPPTVVMATCDASAHQWSCPSGARLYARAETAGVCRPFHGASGLGSVGPWGLSDMARVPTDDGRCLWVADSAALADGTIARNVALEPDPNAPFGTCPTESLTPPTPIVTVEGPPDPSILVQIDGGYRLGGKTHVLYRIFRTDPTATFGAVEVGGGVGRWDQNTQRIVIPDPSKPFPWGLDLDLGDAQLVASDGTHAFVWGCAQPGQFLKQGCELARLDAGDAVELFSKNGQFLPTVDASQGATVFFGGTWMSSVAAAPSGFVHVWMDDFGSTIHSDVASDPTATWTPSKDLAQCDLPTADDPKSFCAGPIVHSELADPTRPGELPITYGVGSSSLTTPPGTADDYWPRLVWVE